MALLNTLKTWWGSSRVPSVEQRHETLDSFYHKEESIPISAITNLQNVLNQKADIAQVANTNIVLLPPGSTSYNVTEGTLISHITFLNVPAPFTFAAVLPDFSKYVDEVEVANNDVVDCKKFFAESTVIDFIGIDPNTIIRITKG
jgi:hypothetical protein